MCRSVSVAYNRKSGTRSASVTADLQCARVDVRIGLWDTDVVKGVMRSGRREVHSGSREVTSGLASALFVLVMWRGVDRNVKLWDIEITKGGLSPGCNVVPIGVARGHLRGAIRSFYV